MSRSNADKVMANAKKIADLLRNTNASVRILKRIYKTSHALLKKAALREISIDEWRLIIKKKQSQGGVNTRFKPGDIAFQPPKGVHYSPKTEFKKGNLPHNCKSLFTITVRRNRRDKRGPYRMIAVPGPTPIRNKWIPYAQYIWEKGHVPLPKGMLIAHKDNCTMNDRPENLIAVNRRGNLALMKKNNPGWKKKAVKSYKKTVQLRQKRKSHALRLAQREADISRKQELQSLKIAQVEAEHKKMAEQRMLELFGPQLIIWECTNCSYEYEQASPPERCTKCGRFSFEKNAYRRKTG